MPAERFGAASKSSPACRPSAPPSNGRMAETRVPGPVPRFELPEWKERFGIVAGITGRGAEPAPFDLGLAGKTAPVGEVMGRWRAFPGSLPEVAALVVAR